MPRITLDGDLTRNSIEQSFGGDGDDSVTILPRNDWAYRVMLSQPIYAGRRELRAYSQAKIGIENAREGDARHRGRRRCCASPRTIWPSSTPTAASTSSSRNIELAREAA